MSTVRDLDRALDLARGLDRTLDPDLGRTLDRALVRIAIREPANTEGLSREVSVAWPARRLAGIGTRLLPAADRVRYSEEFRSEVWDLAEAGASRWRQITHAARQFAQIGQLRAELNSSQRRKTSPRRRMP